MLDILKILRIILNKIRIHIQNKENWSTKIKDILSLEIIIFILGMLSYILIKIVKLFWNTVLLPLLINITLSIDAMKEGKIEIQPNILAPLSSFSDFIELAKGAFWTTIIFTLLFSFLIWMEKKVNERIMGILWSITGCIGISAYFFLYPISWQLIFIGFPILLLFLYKLPFGSGKYLKSLQYVDYLFDSFNGYSIKEDIKQIIIILFIGSFLFISIFVTIPGITIIVALLLASIIILLLLKNLSIQHTNFLIETIIYLLLVPFVILSNKESVNDTLSLVITFGTLYFVIDRVFSLKEKAKTIIMENSTLYYLEEDISEIKKSSKILLPLSYFKFEKFTEIEIIRQALYYWRFDEVHNYNILYEQYRNSEYTQYLLLLGEVKYSLDFEESLNEEEEIEFIKYIIQNIENTFQTTHCYPITEHWVRTLNNDVENASYIVKLVKDESNILSEDVIKIYKEALNITRNKKSRNA